MAFPIRKSNKPPYIYWKRLIIIGVILLAVTLPMASLSTYTYEINLLREKNSLKLIEGVRIPERVPEDLITQLGEYYTNLSVEPYILNPEQCKGVRFTVFALGSNNSISVDTTKNVKASLTSPGVEIYELKDIEGGIDCDVLVNYTYVVHAVERPYSFLLFLSIFTSVSGAACGVLGVVLMIKQRVLKNVEDQYL